MQAYMKLRKYNQHNLIQVLGSLMVAPAQAPYRSKEEKQIKTRKEETYLAIPHCYYCPPPPHRPL